jgi:hypothetical protein
MTRRILPALLLVAAAVGVVAGWKLKPAPDVPTFTPKTVYVTDTVELYRDKPDVKPSLPHKVFWKEARPTQTVLTTTTPERPRVETYCAPVERKGPDSLRAPDPVKADVKALLPPVALKYDGKRLRFWSALGDGRAFYQENKVGTPFEAVVHDSTWTVRSRRFNVDLGAFVEANYVTGAMPAQLRGGATLEVGPIEAQAGAGVRLGPKPPEGELFAGLRKTF